MIYKHEEPNEHQQVLSEVTEEKSFRKGMRLNNVSLNSYAQLDSSPPYHNRKPIELNH